MESIENWQCLKNSDQVEHRFVVMLSPILDYIHKAVLQHIHTLPMVSHLFEKFDLQAWLRQDLCRLFSPLLARSCAVELYYAKQEGQLTGETPEDRFQSFIDLLEKPSFVTHFMQKYHVLQGVIDRRATNYLNALCEFLDHLNHDFSDVSKQILHHTSHLILDQLTSDGADVHCQGKRVFILHFKDFENKVQRLVYKPHQLEPELAFNQIINWINPWLPESSLLPMNLVNYEDHGWVEFFEHLPCFNEEEIKIFYQRSGHLLALLYIFNGLDIHFDNIIAHGAYPILIDLECFLYPVRSIEHLQTFHFPTVLDCLLLPSRIGNDEQKSGIDISALGFGGNQIWYTKKFTWKNAGTDEMRFARIDSSATPSKNQPFIKNIGDINYLNYGNEILQGFEKVYLIFLNHQHDFMQKFSNLLSELQIRLVFRPTSQYYELLFESHHPSLLRNPSAYQKHMDWLKEILKDLPSHEPLIAAEYHDLSHGDIPYFGCKTNELDVFDSYGKTTGYRLQQSGFEFFSYRLEHVFSPKDCQIQKHFIEMSFALAQMNQEKHPSPSSCINDQELDEQSHEQISESYLAHAERILDELSQFMMVSHHQVAWPDIELDMNAKFPILNPGVTNKGLYSGYLGILLSFLYGEQQIHKESYQHIISQCLSNLTDVILDDKTDCWNKDISAFSGYASVLYTLCVAEKFGYVSNPFLQEKMLQKIQLNLKDDKVYDVIGGAAGTLLVLLKLSHDQKSINTQPLIHELIQHLLKAYPDPAVLPKSLKKNYDKSSPGFSHGVAGIAYALWQARSVFSNDQTTSWIQSALLYIQQLYDENGYFPDARSLDKISKRRNSAHPPLWCHGHVGIGLLYLELHRQNSPLSIHAPLSNILKEIQDIEHKCSEGNLCCGSLGELELLYQLAQFTQTKETKLLFAKACHRLLHCLDHKNYASYTKGGGFSTNLMQGKSGIAYTLLRLSQPDQVSPVLLLQ